ADGGAVMSVTLPLERTATEYQFAADGQGVYNDCLLPSRLLKTSSASRSTRRGTHRAALPRMHRSGWPASHVDARRRSATSTVGRPHGPSLDLLTLQRKRESIRALSRSGRRPLAARPPVGRFPSLHPRGGSTPGPKLVAGRAGLRAPQRTTQSAFDR